MPYYCLSRLLLQLLTGTNSTEPPEAHRAVSPATTDLTAYPATSSTAQLRTATATYQPYQPTPMVASVVPVPAPSSFAQATSSYAVSNTNNNTSNRQTPVNQPIAAPAAGISMVEATRATSGFFPALPSSFPELEKMSVLQLQRLLNDEVSLQVCTKLECPPAIFKHLICIRRNSLCILGFCIFFDL